MERARQAQTKRVVSPTDETREEGITPLLSVSFSWRGPQPDLGTFLYSVRSCVCRRNE